MLGDKLSSAIATEAIELFKKLFGDTGNIGVQMVVRHISGIEPEDVIAASCVALSQDLIKSVLIIQG